MFNFAEAKAQADKAKASKIILDSEQYVSLKQHSWVIFWYLLFKQRENASFFAIMALRRRIIYKVQKGRNALSTFERALLFCCKSLWLALGQWFQSYNFPLPRLRFLKNGFLIMLFCNVPFLQWLPTSFPSLFPSELSASFDAFNRPPPPVYILLPPNQPRSLEHSTTRIIHSAIYLYISI